MGKNKELHEELKYYIAIQFIPNIGAITAKKLIAYCGSVSAVFEEKKQALLKISGVGEVLVSSIINNRELALEKAQQEIDFIEKNNIQAFLYTENNYPRRLQNCDDGPLVLFAKGDVDFNAQKILSIVGTRKATAYGTSLCEQLIADLAVKHKPIIVSGLAYGIDICAHKAALANNLQTIAVMGTGLNTVYPAQHKSIAKKIETQGAIVSDFTSQAKLDPANFLRRNRIIAGLADATIVVESGERGGALVTADIAVSYNRDVLAFPARVSDSQSRGCNKLIKINKAAMIESIDDLEYVLAWDSQKETNFQLPLFDTLSEKEIVLINHLKEKDKDSIDNIARETRIPMAQLSSMLLTLEFSGYIKSLPGKMYSLNLSHKRL